MSRKRCGTIKQQCLRRRTDRFADAHYAAENLSREECVEEALRNYKAAVLAKAHR